MQTTNTLKRVIIINNLKLGDLIYPSGCDEYIHDKFQQLTNNGIGVMNQKHTKSQIELKGSKKIITTFGCKYFTVLI